MSLIKISEDDPVVSRLQGGDFPILTEIGYIPGDEFGCKIYGRNHDGRMMLIGIHSSVYGCPIREHSVGVEIVPSPIRK